MDDEQMPKSLAQNSHALPVVAVHTLLLIISIVNSLKQRKVPLVRRIVVDRDLVWQTSLGILFRMSPFLIPSVMAPDQREIPTVCINVKSRMFQRLRVSRSRLSFRGV